MIFNKGNSTKELAKSRLKLVLVQDRLNCSTEMLEMIKIDIINVIAGYMEIDDSEIDIQISQGEAGEEGKPVLIANIPVKNLRKLPKQNN